MLYLCNLEALIHREWDMERKSGSWNTTACVDLQLCTDRSVHAPLLWLRPPCSDRDGSAISDRYACLLAAVCDLHKSFSVTRKVHTPPAQRICSLSMVMAVEFCHEPKDESSVVGAPPSAASHPPRMPSY